MYIKFSQHAKPNATDTIATVTPEPVDFIVFELLVVGESRSGVSTILYPKYFILSSHNAATRYALTKLIKMNNPGYSTAKSFIPLVGLVVISLARSLSDTSTIAPNIRTTIDAMVETIISNTTASGVVSKNPHAML